MCRQKLCHNWFLHNQGTSSACGQCAPWRVSIILNVLFKWQHFGILHQVITLKTWTLSNNTHIERIINVFFLSDFVTVNWFCDSQLVLWQSTGFVTFNWFCDSQLVLWHSTGFVTLNWFCDIQLVLWQSTGFVTVNWCCDSQLVLWQSTDFVTVNIIYWKQFTHYNRCTQIDHSIRSAQYLNLFVDVGLTLSVLKLHNYIDLG